MKWLLEEGCHRNVPAELIHEDKDGSVLTGRVRLLGLTPKHLLADRPICMDGDGEVPVGVPITVHVSVNGSRFQFESVIEEDNRWVQLNARQTVPGIALRKPHVITQSQRRSHLRISMVGYEPVGVTLARPDDEAWAACRVDASVASGWMLDLSVGGLSVLVDRRVIGPVAAGNRFFATFHLPTVEEELVTLVVVRHSRLVTQKEALRLGLGFRTWKDPAWPQNQRRISRFVVDHERRMLRRRK